MDAIEGKIVNRDDDEPEVFNLDVWLRESAEEDEEKHYSFEFNGEVYTLLSPEDFDWQAQSRGAANQDKGDLRPFVQMLMGEEQYERFCANPYVPAKAIDKIAGDWNEHHGISVPESRASRRASERTAKRPKPTSRRRTK